MGNDGRTGKVDNVELWTSVRVLGMQGGLFDIDRW